MSVRDLIPWGRNRDERAVAPWGNETGDPFVAFQREFDRLFDNLWRSFDSHLPVNAGFGGGGTLWPSIEISETDTEIRVSAELPGMDEEDVELLLDDGALTLRGEKVVSREGWGRHFSERFHGRFERRIPLPAEVDQDKADAQFANGVLTVTLPKSEAARARVRRLEIHH